MNVASTVKKYKNEIQALKMAQPINGGNLTKHSVQARWSGQIDKNNPISKFSLLAAFKATFTRTDGIEKPPFVQFSFSLSPDSDASESGGVVISFGENSVDYRICLFTSWWPFGNSASTGIVTLTCSAYSPVEGTLSLERVYS